MSKLAKTIRLRIIPDIGDIGSPKFTLQIVHGIGQNTILSQLGHRHCEGPTDLTGWNLDGR
jgi:hypothetical protein